MKKYFLLFTASFIAFEACLIAGSSSSYGMEPKFDEANQSIVLYNSQGQKTRKLPLYAEDLAADLRLNPTKGETLWFEKSKLITIPGYQEPFEVEGDIEITLSPIALLEDCFVVQLGLHAYNLHAYNIDKIEDFSQLLLKTPYIKEGGVAALFQESLILEFDNLLPKIELDKAAELLIHVETSAYAKGARRAYAIVSNGKENITHVNWIEILEIHNYQLSGEAYDLNERLYVQHFYKELAPQESNKDKLTELGFKWDGEEDEEKQFAGNFGIFVRKNGSIKGGLFGRINENAAIPHSVIDVLWIDDKLRGMRLGAKLMNFALKHSKERGAHVAELATADFQAPWFYEKMGFEKILTDPHLLKTLDGKLNHSYLYRKEL